LPQYIRRGDIDKINGGETKMTARDYQYLLDLYDAELTRADEYYGQLFDTLQDNGLWDNTVIAFFSDHGEEMGEHGQWSRHTYSLYNELLHTPLIIRGPGVPKGQVVDAPVRLVDLAPTLLRLAGLDPPQTFMGKDLAPVWDGQERDPREVVAEKPDLRSLMASGYKLFSDGRLFDLEVDPTEQVDVAASEPEVLSLMQQRLDEWTQKLVAASEGVHSAGPVNLTHAEKKRLRALGYIQ